MIAFGVLLTLAILLSFLPGRSNRRDWQGRMQSKLGESVQNLNRADQTIGDAREILGQSTHTLTPEQAKGMDAIASDLDAVRHTIAQLQTKIEHCRNVLEDIA